MKGKNSKLGETARPGREMVHESQRTPREKLSVTHKSWDLSEKENIKPGFSLGD